MLNNSGRRLFGPSVYISVELLQLQITLSAYSLNSSNKQRPTSRRRVIGWLSWTASPYQMAEPISINKSGVLMRMWGDVGDLGIMYPAKRPRITNTCSSMLEKGTGEERNSS